MIGTLNAIKTSAAEESTTWKGDCCKLKMNLTLPFWFARNTCGNFRTQYRKIDLSFTEGHIAM
jgi:hypothetical protein